VFARLNGLAIHSDDDVADLDFAAVRVAIGLMQAGLARGTAWSNAPDQGAVADAEAAGDFVLCGPYAEARTHDPPVLDQLRDDAIHFVHWNGKADAGISAGRAVNGGVHTDKPAGAVEQRTAGIAGIHRGVGLDYVFQGSRRVVLQFSAQSADDPLGQ